MAIQFCAVPLKLRKTCPGMETRIAISKNIKRVSNDISIVNKN